MSKVTNLKITCLSEESAPRLPFWGAHGLSFLIEADGKKILFDTGSYSDVLSHNSQSLNFDLSTIDAFFLSHTHDDHSGGLFGISNDIKDKPMYCTSDAFSDRMPESEELKKIMTNVNIISHDKEIFPGVIVIKEEKSINPKYPVNESFIVADLEGKGLILILGCSHPGIEHIIDRVKLIFEGIPIHAIVGGLHLKDSSDEEIARLVSLIKKEKIQIVLANHCTGFKALKELSTELPEATKFITDTVTGSFHTGKEYIF